MSMVMSIFQLVYFDHLWYYYFYLSETMNLGSKGEPSARR